MLSKFACILLVPGPIVPLTFINCLLFIFWKICFHPYLPVLIQPSKVLSIIRILNPYHVFGLIFSLVFIYWTSLYSLSFSLCRMVIFVDLLVLVIVIPIHLNVFSYLSIIESTPLFSEVVRTSKLKVQCLKHTQLLSLIYMKLLGEFLVISHQLLCNPSCLMAPLRP